LKFQEKYHEIPPVNRCLLYDAYGSVDNGKFSATQTTAFGAGNNNAFFTGKPYVEGLGYAFMFRNYRSDLGKWQTADPLGYPDGWNNFAYGNNDIINGIDYQGTKWVSAGSPDDQRGQLTTYTRTITGEDGCVYVCYIYKTWQQIKSWTLGDAYGAESKSFRTDYTLGASLAGTVPGLGVTLTSSRTDSTTDTYSTAAGRKNQYDIYQEVDTYVVYTYFADGSASYYRSVNYTNNFSKVVTGWKWVEE